MPGRPSVGIAAICKCMIEDVVISTRQLIRRPTSRGRRDGSSRGGDLGPIMTLDHCPRRLCVPACDLWGGQGRLKMSGIASVGEGIRRGGSHTTLDPILFGIRTRGVASPSFTCPQPRRLPSAFFATWLGRARFGTSQSLLLKTEGWGRKTSQTGAKVLGSKWQIVVCSAGRHRGAPMVCGLSLRQGIIWNAVCLTREGCGRATNRRSWRR